MVETPTAGQTLGVLVVSAGLIWLAADSIRHDIDRRVFVATLVAGLTVAGYANLDAYGVRRVFWGVAESNHLVDVINQTDAIENPDQEDKLGQPMLNLAYVEYFCLPVLAYSLGLQDSHVEYLLMLHHHLGDLLDPVRMQHTRSTHGWNR